MSNPTETDPNAADLYEAIRTVQAAAANWCEYLADNDRDGECEDIDIANDRLDEFVKVLR